MSSHRLFLALALAASGGSLAPAAAAGQSFRTISVARQIQGEQDLTVDVEFAAGTFELKPGQGSALYRAQIVYDEDHFTPSTRYRASSNTLRIGVSSDGLGGFKRDVTSRQRMFLAITPAVPTKLELKLGAVKADIELGGLSLIEGTIKTGATEIQIAFSSPNRVSCRDFTLKTGAAEVLVEQLGNARCRHIEVVGGAAHITLDFTGEWDASVVTTAEIKLGIGALTLRLPEDLGVEVELSRLLASFEQTGFAKHDSHYVSHNYDTAAAKLHLDVKAVLGDISVEWVKK